MAVTNLATGGNTSGATLSLTTLADVPAGAAIVVGVGDRTSSLSSQAVSDSAGNTYVRQTSGIQGGNLAGSIYVAKNVSFLAAGSTITITKGASDNVGASAILVTGVDTATCVDAATPNSAGANGNASVLSGTPTNANCLFIGFVFAPGNTGTFNQDSIHAAYSTPPNEATSGTAGTSRRVNGGNFVGSGTTAYFYSPTYSSTPAAAVASIIALIPGTGGTGTIVTTDVGCALETNSSAANDAKFTIDCTSSLQKVGAITAEIGLAETRSLTAAVETSSQMNTDVPALLDGKASLAATQTAPIDDRSSLIAESNVPIEWTGTASVTVFGDQSVPVEFAASVLGATRAEIDERGSIISQSPLQSDFGVGAGTSQSGQIETSIVVQRDSRADTEASIGIKSDILIPTEWTGTAVITINGDSVSPLEFGTSIQRTVFASAALLGTISTDALVTQGTLVNLSTGIATIAEIGASLSRSGDAGLSIIASIGTQVSVSVEWSGFGQKLIGTVRLAASKVTVSLDGLKAPTHLDGKIDL